MNGKITMTISIGCTALILTMVMFTQFKTVEQTDITAIETMRETELRAELANWKTKYEEIETKLSETEGRIAEYQSQLSNSAESETILEKELDESGFVKNYIFYGAGWTVAVDIENGKIAMVSFWNPSVSYVLPADRITKTWVDDGKSGFGIFEGSGRVSFLFMIDDVKIRVNTFTSNTRFRMDSEYILTGISKADMMVEVLENARKKVK